MTPLEAKNQGQPEVWSLICFEVTLSLVITFNHGRSGTEFARSMLAGGFFYLLIIQFRIKASALHNHIYFSTHLEHEGGNKHV